MRKYLVGAGIFALLTITNGFFKSGEGVITALIGIGIFLAYGLIEHWNLQ